MDLWRQNIGFRAGIATQIPATGDVLELRVLNHSGMHGLDMLPDGLFMVMTLAFTIMFCMIVIKEISVENPSVTIIRNKSHRKAKFYHI